MKKLILFPAFLLPFICFSQVPPSVNSTPVNASDIHAPSSNSPTTTNSYTPPVNPSTPSSTTNYNSTISTEPPRNVNTSFPTSSNTTNSSSSTPTITDDVIMSSPNNRAIEVNHQSQNRRMGNFILNDWQYYGYSPYNYTLFNQVLQENNNMRAAGSPNKPSYIEVLHSLQQLSSKGFFLSQYQIQERQPLTTLRVNQMMEIAQQIQDLSVFADQKTFLSLQPVIKEIYGFAYTNYLKENKFNHIHSIRIEKIKVSFEQLEQQILDILKMYEKEMN